MFCYILYMIIIALKATIDCSPIEPSPERCGHITLHWQRGQDPVLHLMAAEQCCTAYKNGISYEMGGHPGDEICDIFLVGQNFRPTLRSGPLTGNCELAIRVCSVVAGLGDHFYDKDEEERDKNETALVPFEKVPGGPGDEFENDKTYMVDRTSDVEEDFGQDVENITSLYHNNGFKDMLSRRYCQQEFTFDQHYITSNKPIPETALVKDFMSDRFCIVKVLQTDCLMLSFAAERLDLGTSGMPETIEECGFAERPPSLPAGHGIDYDKSCEKNEFTRKVCTIAVLGDEEKFKKVSEFKVLEVISLSGSSGHQTRVVVKYFCYDKCYRAICNLKIRGVSDGVEIVMVSSLAYYHITMGGITYEGEFSTSKDLKVSISSPGTFRLQGHCNGRYTTRSFAFSTDEFCDGRYPGYLMIFGNVYCKNYKVIQQTFIAGLILLALYFLSDVVSSVIAGLLTIFFLLIARLLFWKRFCQNCMQFKSSGPHVCKHQDLRECPFCKEDLKTNGTDSNDVAKGNYNDHIRNCSSRMPGSIWWLCIVSTFKVFYTIISWFTKKIPQLSMGIIMVILIFYFLPVAEGSAIDQIVKRIGDDLETKEEAFQKKHSALLCRPTIFIIFGVVTGLLAATMTFCYLYGELLLEAWDWIMRSFNRKRCYRCMGYYADGDHRDLNCGTAYCPICNILLLHPPEWKVSESFQSFYDGHITHHFSSSSERWHMFAKNIMMGSLKNAIKWVIFFYVILALVHFTECAGNQMMHSDEMSNLERDLGEYIEEMKKTGFHPYKSRFTGGARQDISSLEEKKKCNKGKCVISMEVESDMIVTQGKEYGYNVLSEELKDTQIKLNMKVSEPRVYCDYKEIYKTGEVLHKATTGDTCTSGCGECMKNLRMDGYNGEILHERQHEGTASWSCDGPGCLSIGGGCTCMKCWCTVEAADWSIKKIVKEEPTFDLCMAVGNRGLCKQVKQDDRNNIYRVLKYNFGQKYCPEIIACKGSVCYEGAINDVDEQFPRFGSVKVFGNKILSYEDIQAEEICHFAQNRFYHVSKCCMDTYGKWRDLKPLESVASQSGLIIYLKEVGSWKIRVTLPNFHYMQKVDEVVVKAGPIYKCHGCHSCNEGGSCLVDYNSNFEHTFEFSCTGCRTDSSLIHALKGKNTEPFNIFCDKERGNVTCQIGNETASGEYHLSEEPKVPHGNFEVNIDVKKNVISDCDGWFCGFKMPFMDIWNRIKYAIIVVGIVLFLYLLLSLLIPLCKRKTS